VGDGRVSSESTEEIERIVIEDSADGKSYMVRTVGPEIWVNEGEEPVPLRDDQTPVMESTPVEGRDKEKEKVNLRPLIAPKKKLWVEPEKDQMRGKAVAVEVSPPRVNDPPRV